MGGERRSGSDGGWSSLLGHHFHFLLSTCTHHVCPTWAAMHRIRNLFGMYKSGPLLAIPVFAAIYMGLLYLLVVSTFFLASFVDPGVYPRGEVEAPPIYVCVLPSPLHIIYPTANIMHSSLFNALQPI